MRFIQKQLSLWRIVLIIGAVAIAIPIAAHVRATGMAVVNQPHENLAQPTAGANGDHVKHSKASKAVVGRGAVLPQDDYYDRRREYWDRRVERRLDRREEYLDEETGDDKNADAKDSKKDSKADKDDGDDEEDSSDQEIERRREYWRKRLDRDW